MYGILVRHSYGKKEIQKEADTDKFMISHNGMYFYRNEQSKYSGLYFPEAKDHDTWTMFRTIENIRITGKDNILVNRFNSFERETDSGKLEYYFAEGSLILNSGIKGELLFTLDMREVYDFDDRGRIYNVRKDGNLIIVEYRKYSDSVLENLNYTRFLCIMTDIVDYIPILEWKEKQYNEDEERKSFPWKLYVFEAFKLNAKTRSKIAISFSHDEKLAISQAKLAFVSKNSSDYRFLQVSQDPEKNMALNCAVKSMQDLRISFENSKGYYAGLPWFFQIWTRDEAISVKSLMELGNYDEAKELLVTMLGSMLEDGRIQNRIPVSGLGTADGTGWVFKRILDLIAYMESRKLEIDPQALGLFRASVKKSVDLHLMHHLKEGLIWNSRNETWMDTSFGNDFREGFRIEVQSLFLAMLRLINYLGPENMDKDYRKIELDMKSKIRETFLEGNILKDGKNDPTIRPNIFLACYISQDILSTQEWINVFDRALPALWLDWGGLSTIDKSSQIFFKEYTGEDNKSYHRGDSWYFINNIAAICMHNVDKVRYSGYISKIADASARDMLYQGIIGRPSELSSASSQKANASLFQLWSAATFIELINLTNK